MPRHPTLGSHCAELRTSVFAILADLMSKAPGDVIRLHIGDTYLCPPPRARFEAPAWPELEAQGLYRYSHPNGIQPLREALGEKLARRNALLGGADAVQITVGATQAIFSATRALLDPGDEVLLAAPYWPLIRGIVWAAGGVPVEVPISDPLYEDPDADAGALLATAITDRTTLVYLCTPNNPDGKVLTRAQLEQIAEVARRHDLWILSDEAYEEYVFAPGQEHLSIGATGGMAERTATVFTFSKSYAMSGSRLGYLHAPEPWLSAIRRMSGHVVYNPPEPSQRCGLAALEHGAGWLAEARAAYARAREETVSALTSLGTRFHVPDGGAYAFARIPGHRPQDDPWEFIQNAVNAGVSLSPGEPFGQAYRGWFRLCYTAVPMAELREGLTRLGPVMKAAAERT